MLKNDIKNKDLKCIDINTKLHEEDIVIVYNKKFLSTAPIKFIKDYTKLDIK